jgi:HAE1 family hydrophobic/amphiphilic exporter-1
VSDELEDNSPLGKKSFSEPFIRRPVMTLVLTASALLFGVLAYRTLPVNDLPAVDYPVIQVNAAYPGASPETMANNVATPLEKQFMKMPGLELVTSKSTQGFTVLTLQFSLEKSIDGAASDVQTAISQATGNLPTDLPSPPSFTKTNPNDQPIMYIGLTTDTMTNGQLYDLANTQVGQRISIVSGVSQVQIFGTKTAIRVKADPSALATRGMSMADLADAIKKGTSYTGAGQFDGPYRTFILQPQGQLSTAAEYSKLIIGTKDGQPIYLEDVAEVRESVENERNDMRFWVRGKPLPAATVVVAVYRQAGSNAVQVAQAVRDLLPQVSATLPNSITILPIYDRSRTIVNSVKDVQETLFIAFILVVMVIFVFLGRATDTLIPVVALPMSLLLTFIVMRILNYSVDNLSLMALTLAIGFLVDDAIVFLENVVRRMEQYGEQPMRATFNSAREISFTIISMTLSLAAVFLPLVFMSGLVGRIFREFAVTIVVSIIASGVVSLTLTPLMCARLLSYRGHGTKKTWMERGFGAIESRVLHVYGRSLWFFLRHKWVSALLWILCLGGTVFFFQKVPKSFLPIGDSGFIMGVMIAPEGTSPEEMRRMQSVAEKVMQDDPASDMTFSASGNGNFMQQNMAFMLTFLKDKKERPPITAVNGRIMGGIMQAVPGAIAGLRPQPVLQISTGATANQTGQFTYTISGLNPQEVYGVAGQLMGRLATWPGFAMMIPDLYTKTPGLRINILREQASMYHVSARRIEELLRNAYSENYVYLVKQPQDQYQVILEVKQGDRRHPEDLAKLYVQSDDGKTTVPLSAVATWQEVLGPTAVNHTNQFTSVSLSFDLVPGTPIGDAVEHIEKTAKEVVPPNIRGDFQGEALTFRDTGRSLVILMALAVFVMYVILAVLYESFLHPLTVLSTLPTALVGGLATLLIFNEEASLYAMIGLFMLMGIVKKNGIMIVDFANHRVAQGETAEKAIHDASMDRFRPIVMTTLAAVMGAVPIALGFGSDGEGRRPLGLVIVGGLLVSQLITLYITPVIYLYMELFQEKMLGRFKFLHTPADAAPDRGAALATAGADGNGNGSH